LASINSRSITFPRNDEKVTDCPVKPLALTAGNVKSGILFDVEEDVTVDVTCDELVEG